MTLLGATVLAGCGDRPASSSDADQAVPVHEGRWERVRGPARGGRGFQNMVPVVVGDGVVLIAGVDYDQQVMKALVLDPEARRWSLAAPSDIWWRFGISAVEAAGRVIAFGGCCGGGGHGSQAPGTIYDPERDRWSPVSHSPLGVRYNHTAVSTGEEMIVWGGTEGLNDLVSEELRRDGTAYDPRSDSWRAVASAPLRARERHTAVWTGEEMIIWGGSRPGRQGGRLLDGAAYDPQQDRWRRLRRFPLLPDPPRSRHLLVKSQNPPISPTRSQRVLHLPIPSFIRPFPTSLPDPHPTTGHLTIHLWEGRWSDADRALRTPLQSRTVRTARP